MVVIKSLQNRIFGEKNKNIAIFDLLFKPIIFYWYYFSNQFQFFQLLKPTAFTDQNWYKIY